MGAINPWNICSGLIFVRITSSWKKFVSFLFFFLYYIFFRNAKHVQIISKERKVRKFVESARISSNSFRLVRFIDLSGNDLCYSSSLFFIRFPFHRPSSSEEMKISFCCSRKIDSDTLHFAPLLFILLRRMGFLVSMIILVEFLMNFFLKIYWLRIIL